MINRFLPFPWLTNRSLARRTRHIIAVLTRHGWGWLLSQVESGRVASRSVRLPGSAGIPRSHQKQAEHLRLAMNELGATFIKLGQALSTRPDILPKDISTSLANYRMKFHP